MAPSATVRWSAIPVTLLHIGCNSSGGPLLGPASVASISLQSLKDSVQIFDSVQYLATLRDAAGNVLTGRTVSWSSSNTSVATVTLAGWVKGVRPGSVTLTASSENKTGMATVRVTENWTFETGTRITSATSSCTIQLPGGTFRLWLAGLITRTSSDGLTWSTAAPVAGVSAGSGEFLRNPAVVKLQNGTYVMIYESAPQSGSGALRFFRATSSNALSWTKVAGSGTNGAVMEPGPKDTSFVSVPDLILLSNGSLRLYFVAGGNHVETALSSDDGATWTREGPVTITGLASGRTHVDPDIIRRADGTYRLFLAAPPQGQTLNNKRIISATSTDGRTFTLEAGERVGVANTSMDRLDPDVILLAGGTFRMYLGESTTSGPGARYDLKSATSP